MTLTTPENELPFTEYFHDWRDLGVVKAAFPDYAKAEEVWKTVREKLSETQMSVQCKTQYSTTHDAALGILNELKLRFESGGVLGKKEKRFAENYLGMWDPETEIYENLETSLDVLRAAKRDTFRKIIELEDQIPKLKADEERTRKLYVMESEKLKDIYDELRKKHEAAEEEAVAAQAEEEAA